MAGSIPIVTQRLSEHFRVPVALPQPALTSAGGAPLVDQRTMSADAPTGMAPTMARAAGPAGWAGGPETMAAPVPPVDANLVFDRRAVAGLV